MHVTVIKQGHVTPNLLKIWYLFSESDKHKRLFDVPAWKLMEKIYAHHLAENRRKMLIILN